MSNPSNLDDILSCPVCYGTFSPGVKILQCKTGHAICERCHPKLKNCAICKEALTGTRNFLMEEMVKKLRRLSTGALLSLDDESVMVNLEIVDSNVAAEEIKLDEQEAKKRRKREKKKMNKKLKKLREEGQCQKAVPETTQEIRTVTISKLSMTDPPNANNSKELTKKKTKLREEMGLKHPPQFSGEFPCPANESNNSPCQKKLPFCRLYNHLRSVHSENYIAIEAAAESDNLVARFQAQINVPVEDYRYVMHVREFGLFVLVFSVKNQILDQPSKINQITAFVKKIGTATEAKSFTYSVQVVIGKYLASCTDLCHFSFSDEKRIIKNEQCLILQASKLSDMALVTVELQRNTGFRSRSSIKPDVKIIANFESLSVLQSNVDAVKIADK